MNLADAVALAVVVEVLAVVEVIVVAVVEVVVEPEADEAEVVEVRAHYPCAFFLSETF